MCQCIVYTLFSCDEVVAVPLQVLTCMCKFSVDYCMEVVTVAYGDRRFPRKEVFLVGMVLQLQTVCVDFGCLCAVEVVDYVLA